MVKLNLATAPKEEAIWILANQVNKNRRSKVKVFASQVIKEEIFSCLECPKASLSVNLSQVIYNTQVRGPEARVTGLSSSTYVLL